MIVYWLLKNPEAAKKLFFLIGVIEGFLFFYSFGVLKQIVVVCEFACSSQGQIAGPRPSGSSRTRAIG